MEIDERIKKCVAFACYKDELNDNNEPNRIAGTIFFIAVGLDKLEVTRFYYAVTAKHVVEWIEENCVDDKLTIRINKKDGGYTYVDTELSDWKFHPCDSSVDVAVLSFGGHGSKYSASKYDIQYLSTEMIITEEAIRKCGISEGHDVFLTGLFVNHFGEHRNLPIIRTGNISLMPEEPIQDTDYGPMEAYLIEVRSIGGLSGSPVFVYSNMTLCKKDTSLTVSLGPTFSLLGLVHGHWDLKVSEEDMLLKDILPEKWINMGLAIVVPATKILEVLDQKCFKDIRDVVRRKELKKRKPVMD